jgi:hypothetical protein
MDSPRTNDVQARIRTCPGCQYRMADVANAMRRHENQMSAAIQLAQSDLSEERRQEIAVEVTASFNKAHGAWSAYREHLIQHGITPAGSPECLVTQSVTRERLVASP